MSAQIIKRCSGGKNRNGRQRPVTLTPIFSGVRRQDLPDEPHVSPVKLQRKQASLFEATPIRDIKFHAEDNKEISTEINVGPVVFRQPANKSAI